MVMTGFWNLALQFWQMTTLIVSNKVSGLTIGTKYKLSFC